MKLYDTNELRASKLWPYAVAAGCVIYRTNDGKVEALLLKREAGHPNDPNQKVATYNLPKGHVGFDESLQNAAKREAEEETGTKIEIQTYLGATINEFTHPRYDMFNSKTTHYFAALWLEDITVMDNEHDDKSWLDLDAAIKLLGEPTVHRDEAKFIKHLQKYLELTDAT